MSKLCSETRTACQSSMRSVLKCCKLTFIFALGVEDFAFTSNLISRFMFGIRYVEILRLKWKVKPQMLFLVWYLRNGTSQPRRYQLIVCQNDMCTQHRNRRNVDNVMLYVLLRFECFGDKGVLFEENVHYIEIM